VIYGPLREDAFYEFNYDVHYRIKEKRIPPPWEGQPFEYEKELDLTKLDSLSEDHVSAIIKSFRYSLRRAAEPHRPLIIVLDQWTYDGAQITAVHMDYLVRHLFAKLAGADFGSQDRRSVKLVLVMRDDELDQTYPQLKQKLDGSFHEVHLAGIPGDRFEKVAKEFFRNLRSADASAIRTKARNVNARAEEFFIETIGRKAHPVWQPVLLKEIKCYVEKWF
jgi:hypothetical protein